MELEEGVENGTGMENSSAKSHGAWAVSPTCMWKPVIAPIIS